MLTPLIDMLDLLRCAHSDVDGNRCEKTVLLNGRSLSVDNLWGSHFSL